MPDFFTSSYFVLVAVWACGYVMHHVIMRRIEKAIIMQGIVTSAQTGEPFQGEPSHILVSLMRQVEVAVPKGGNENDVVTIVTRPMWRLWLRSLGECESQEPGPSCRIYGSQTIVVESDKVAAVSMRREIYLKLIDGKKVEA